MTEPSPTRTARLIDFDSWSGDGPREPVEERPRTLTIDLGRGQVLVGSVPLPLTYREFRLLAHLVDNAGTSFDRHQLAESERSWSPISNPRTVDMHIRRLRLKLGEFGEIIRTRRGVGYRYDEHPDVVICPR